MVAIGQVKGARFKGCHQKTLRDCPSHNTVGHATGINDAQTTAGNVQRGRIDSGGIYIWPPLCETHHLGDYPDRGILKTIEI